VICSVFDFVNVVLTVSSLFIWFSLSLLCLQCVLILYWVCLDCVLILSSFSWLLLGYVHFVLILSWMCLFCHDLVYLSWFCPVLVLIEPSLPLHYILKAATKYKVDYIVKYRVPCVISCVSV